MLDAAFIEKCGDPSLTPAIVQQFVAEAGSDDPLALTVKAGGRLILVPKPKTVDQAMDILRDQVGTTAVRVGITQYPAGLGVADVSRLEASLLDACANLRIGTALFAKVARIVTHWYGSPTNRELLPQMLDDAIFAWKTGYFERIDVFRADDPGGATFFTGKPVTNQAATDVSGEQGTSPAPAPPPTAADGDSHAIRIDLTRIGGQK